MEIPINEEGAEAILLAIEDPVTKNLVKFGLARARMAFMRADDETEGEWRRRLPDAPFDLEFFARLLVQIFDQQEIVKSVLGGATVAEASGWTT